MKKQENDKPKEQTRINLSMPVARVKPVPRKPDTEPKKTDKK